MKRVAALVAGIVLAAIMLVLTTFEANEDGEFPGYMEADLVLVGSEQGGRIESLTVEEGDSVKQGDPLFTLESSEQEAAVAATKARVAEAEARLADAKAEVQRPGEIEVLEAALREAKAMRQVATNNLDREGRVDGAYTILSLMSIEIWCRQFVDAPAPRPAEVA